MHVKLESAPLIVLIKADEVIEPSSIEMVPYKSTMSPRLQALRLSNYKILPDHSPEKA
jgi:hypothetical protein